MNACADGKRILLTKTHKMVILIKTEKMKTSIIKKENSFFFKNENEEFSEFNTKSQGIHILSLMFYTEKVDFQNMRELFTNIANDDSIPNDLMSNPYDFKVLETVIHVFDLRAAGIFPKIQLCSCNQHGCVALTKPTTYIVEREKTDDSISISLRFNEEKTADFYSKSDGIIMVDELLRKKKITQADFERLSEDIELQVMLPVVRSDNKKCLKN